MSKTPTMDEPLWWGDKIPTVEPNEDDVPEHLGGHYNFTNMDIESFNWLVEHFNIKSMLDVGCGTGGMVKYAKSIGLEALGIDGDPNMADELVIIHDYTLGKYIPEKKFDLIWSVEFVEHVDEKYIPNFLASFEVGKVLLLSHAQPNQGGKHHVNLQNDGYWIEKLADKWKLDQEATDYIRENSKLYPYIHDNALVFTKI